MSEEYGLKFVVNGEDYDKIKKSLNEQIEDLQQKVEQLENENEYLKMSNPEQNMEHFRIVNENKRKIDMLRKENHQLENIIDVKKYDYDYLETLFSKSSKEDVLKAYTYKCEQLEKVGEARNEFQMKSMQLENIRKEAIECIETDSIEINTKEYGNLTVINSDDLLNILNKGDNNGK